jgi:hypothetical protein
MILKNFKFFILIQIQIYIILKDLRASLCPRNAKRPDSVGASGWDNPTLKPCKYYHKSTSAVKGKTYLDGIRVLWLATQSQVPLRLIQVSV